LHSARMPCPPRRRQGGSTQFDGIE
jgi:hypothetical protein